MTKCEKLRIIKSVGVEECKNIAVFLAPPHKYTKEKLRLKVCDYCAKDMINRVGYDKNQFERIT